MASTPVPDLELTLTATESGDYGMDLRLLSPDADAVLHFHSETPVSFDLAALDSHLDDDTKYGELLGRMLLADPDTLSFFKEKRAIALDKYGLLRVRLLIRDDALQGIRWERLRVPGDDGFLARNERVLFSRYISTTDSRSRKPKSPDAIRALIAVANPSDLDGYGMAEIDVDAEINRAKLGFGEMTADALNDDDTRITLDALTDRLRDGYDVLYLVCHGMLDDAPLLFLETPEGTVDLVNGAAFIERIIHRRR